jgi:rhodanese-related sulfurtransferase
LALTENRILRESLIIIVGVLAISFIFNFTRKATGKGGIPLIADAEAFRVQTNAEFAKIEDAYRLFEEGRAIFIDARAPEVFALGHIEGAINAPPGGEDLAGLTWLADADTYVICYAAEKSQRQAGVAADKLLEMGCEEVFVMMDGFETWRRKGFPVSRAAGTEEE